MTQTIDWTERARHFRARAEELRTIAQDWVTHHATRTLTDLAAEYEEMAARLERAISDQKPDA